TSEQRNQINNPATGLLVFDLSTNSFWFKGGSQWVELVDTSNVPVKRNGSNIYMAISGNAGIGTTNPTQKLQVNGSAYVTDKVGIGVSSPNGELQLSNTLGNRKVVLNQAANNENQYYGLGINAGQMRYQVAFTTDNHVFYSGISNNLSKELLRITGTGELKFFNIYPVRKVVLYEDANNFHQYFGLAMDPGQMRFQVADIDNDHVFYAGTSTTSSTELMRIKGNGKVGIGTTNPTQKLHVNGSAYIVDKIGIGTDNPTQKLHVNGSGYIVDKLGIGIDNPHGELQFSSTLNNRKIVLYENANNNHQFFGMGISTGQIRYQVDATISDHVFYAGLGSTSSAELMRIKGNGNVGIGTTNPNAPLQFSNDLENRKIVLYEGANNNHQFDGFGVNNGSLRYQVPNTGDSHIFYAGASSSQSNELMRIEGNGNVDISGILEIGYVKVEGNAVNISPNSVGTAFCDCPAGTRILGGGASVSNVDVDLKVTIPNSDTQWQVEAFNKSLVNSYIIKAYAICARLGN
ncbi:MAG TPA: hypothetical protein VFV79_09910, partial [Saprospiraceae bacterium]|nr:hypothetical protein [Saprospiraceae bacterium]